MIYSKKTIFFTFFLLTFVAQDVTAMDDQINYMSYYNRSSRKEVELRSMLIDLIREDETQKTREEIAKDYKITKGTLRKRVKLHNDGHYLFTRDLPRIPYDPCNFHHPAFISHVLDTYLTSGLTKAQIQKKFNLGVRTLERWIRNYNQGMYTHTERKETPSILIKRTRKIKKEKTELTQQDIRNMLLAVSSESKTGVLRLEIAKVYGTTKKELENKIKAHNHGAYMYTQDIGHISLEVPRHYDKRFAIEVLKVYFSGAKSKTQIRQEYGLGYTTLDRWLKDFSNGLYDQEMKKGYLREHVAMNDILKRELNQSQVRDMLLAVIDRKNNGESKYRIAKRFNISTTTLVKWISLHNVCQIEGTRDLEKIRGGFFEIYDEKDIASIVQSHLTNKKSHAETIREYQITPKTLNRWLKQFAELNVTKE